MSSSPPSSSPPSTATATTSAVTTATEERKGGDETTSVDGKATTAGGGGNDLKRTSPTAERIDEDGPTAKKSRVDLSEDSDDEAEEGEIKSGEDEDDDKGDKDAAGGNTGDSDLVLPVGPSSAESKSVPDLLALPTTTSAPSTLPTSSTPSSSSTADPSPSPSSSSKKAPSVPLTEEEKRRLKERRRLEQEKEERERMQVLVSNFTEDQLDRYEMFRRAAFPKASIKRVMQAITGASVGHNVVIAMAGIAKVFAGEVIEAALDYAERIGEGGQPLRPKHLREAARVMREKGKLPKTRARTDLS